MFLYEIGEAEVVCDHGCSLDRNLNQNFLITEVYSNESK